MPARQPFAGDSSTWLREAEAHLREAARALEVVGLVDGESARMAVIAYRIAQRIRTDRLGGPFR